jgi:hypothetical protein
MHVVYVVYAATIYPMCCIQKLGVYTVAADIWSMQLLPRYISSPLYSKIGI